MQTEVLGFSDKEFRRQTRTLFKIRLYPDRKWETRLGLAAYIRQK